MAYFLIVLGGVINFLRLKSMFDSMSKEETPYRGQGLVMAFFMGCIFMGAPMALIYWLIFT